MSIHTKRWRAVVTYINGGSPEVFHFEELDELHDLIEGGPSFYEIDRIVVTVSPTMAAAVRGATR
jgi:hypothetical protein